MSTIYEYFFIVFPVYRAKLLQGTESSVCSVAVGAGANRYTERRNACLGTGTESRGSRRTTCPVGETIPAGYTADYCRRLYVRCTVDNWTRGGVLTANHKHYGHQSDRYIQNKILHTGLYHSYPVRATPETTIRSRDDRFCTCRYKRRVGV